MGGIFGGVLNTQKTPDNPTLHGCRHKPDGHLPVKGISTTCEGQMLSSIIHENYIHGIMCGMKVKGSLRNLVALVAIGCMAFVAMCCGRIICLCPDDPDGCGEPCHVCGNAFPDGLSAADPCNHFSCSSIDFLTKDDSLRVVEAADVPNSPCRMPLADAAVPTRSPYRNRARSPTVPTGRCSDSALFRARRVLLLS